MNTNNDIHSMLCMSSDTTLPHNGEHANPLSGTQPSDMGEHTLQAFFDDIASNATEYIHGLEYDLDSLQEAFVDSLQQKLADNNITLQEKLAITLSDSNTFILQSNEDHDTILAALGEDVALQNMFKQLQCYAFAIKGIHLLQASRSIDAPLHEPERYNMCIKGPLSHFYLK